MTDAFWIGLFNLLATIFVAWLAYRTSRVAAKTNDEVREVVKHTNGMKDALVAAAEKAGITEGVAKEVRRREEQENMPTRFRCEALDKLNEALNKEFDGRFPEGVEPTIVDDENKNLGH